jgi:hypothetical protein
MPYQTEGSQSLMLGMLDYIKFEPAVDPLDGEFPCRSFCEPARDCAAASFLAASPQRVRRRLMHRSKHLPRLDDPVPLQPAPG